MLTPCLVDADFDALVYQRPILGTDRRRIDAHLEECRSCFDELALRSGSIAIAIQLSNSAKSKDLNTIVGNVATMNRDIDAYEVIGTLGKGGQGEVLRVRHRTLNVERAMKVMTRPIGANAGELINRFKSEAAAAARLEHANLVPVYDFGETDRFLYYVMKLIVGESLHDLVRRVADRQPHASPDNFRDVIPYATQSDYYKQVASWMTQIAAGLTTAHSAHIIHRDIKPANIMIDENGHPLLTDFGLAKDTVANPENSLVGIPSGTPAYMSPEQARGDAVDHRTDVYSLGATLYELLTYQRPFTGTNPQQVMERLKTELPKPPRSIITSIPQPLEEICLNAMAKHPTHRQQSAAILGRQLEGWISGLTNLDTSSNTSQAAVPGHSKRSRLRPVVCIASGLVVLLGAVWFAGAPMSKQYSHDTNAITTIPPQETNAQKVACCLTALSDCRDLLPDDCNNQQGLSGVVGSSCGDERACHWGPLVAVVLLERLHDDETHPAIRSILEERLAYDIQYDGATETSIMERVESLREAEGNEVEVVKALQEGGRYDFLVWGIVSASSPNDPSKNKETPKHDLTLEGLVVLHDLFTGEERTFAMPPPILRIGAGRAPADSVGLTNWINDVGNRIATHIRSSWNVRVARPRFKNPHSTGPEVDFQSP